MRGRFGFPQTFLIGVLAGTALYASGCASPDTVADMCQRAQECNDLPQGTSMQDCSDALHRCVGNLTSSQRDDWERMMGTCLENNSCELFARCYVDVPWC